jgi:hypothetical protein
MTRGRSTGSWILLAAAVLSAGCAKPLRPQIAAIQQVERLAVRFADDGDFTVVDERANALHPIAAGAAFPLLALVGEAVATGVNHYRDDKSTEALRAFLDSAECRAGFQTAFEDTLRKAGKPTVQVVADAPDDLRASGFDAVLEFSIDDCGFRMTNGVTEQIAAFIALQAKLVQADGTVGWDDRETVIATTSSSVEQLRNEPDLARIQFEAVLRDAGRRMANNLLYP